MYAEAKQLDGNNIKKNKKIFIFISCDSIKKGAEAPIGSVNYGASFLIFIIK
jgi:hypothetical protein